MPATEPLEPTLTKWDRRVLAALDQWDGERGPWSQAEVASLDWRSAWQVAERLRSDDVTTVRATLNGLARLDHAAALGAGSSAGARYVATPNRRRRAHN